MHMVSFLAKRLHLVTTAFGQGVLDAIARVPGMTPARFDLLCLLRQPGIVMDKRFARRAKKRPKAREWPGRDHAEMEFAQIVKRLGLHPSTVSKMVKRLREMGWVKVMRLKADRRTKIVACTDLGLACI